MAGERAAAAVLVPVPVPVAVPGAVPVPVAVPGALSGPQSEALAAALPAAPGAYVLAVALARPVRLSIPALGRPVLAAGLYLYAGSARGPGGLRARVRRHLRRAKAIRWHIDHVTAMGAPAGFLALPGARECALLARLLAVPGMTVPVPGLGSSDCRSCPAHLALAPAGMTAGAALAAARPPPAARKNR